MGLYQTKNTSPQQRGVKKQTIEWKKIFASHVSDKRG